VEIAAENEIIGLAPLAFVITGDDGGTWRLDWVAEQGFDLDTLRVTQLEGDTAGVQRVTVQDGKQLCWPEFVDPADAVEGGRISAATALLDGLLDRIDVVGAPEDWLVDSRERVALAEAVITLLELAEFE
jgi:hypothetical protein